MNDHSSSWESYALLQEKLMRSSRIDSHTWGREAGLNSLLEAKLNGTSCTSEDLKRAEDTAGRRERSRAVTRKKHQVELEVPPDIDAVRILTARSLLKQIEQSVTLAQWAFLRAIGEGFSCSEIGSLEKRPVGSIRVTLHRLRMQLSDFRTAA
jgi:hypothetical protein